VLAFSFPSDDSGSLDAGAYSGMRQGRLECWQH
jgi:hypothetical protein